MADEVECEQEVLAKWFPVVPQYVRAFVLDRAFHELQRSIVGFETFLAWMSEPKIEQEDMVMWDERRHFGSILNAHRNAVDMTLVDGLEWLLR